MGTYDTRGGTPRHNPEFDIDYPCDICHLDPSGDCTCPECEVCGASGDPACINTHMPWQKWPALNRSRPAETEYPDQEPEYPF